MTSGEFCHILSGVSVIEEDGGETRTVSAGDSFVIKPGFKGTWEVLETTRKEYVIRLCRLRVACLLMQKNERRLLEPWIAYHSALFGLKTCSSSTRRRRSE